jgi:hypothetical protein
MLQPNPRKKQEDILMKRSIVLMLAISLLVVGMSATAYAVRKPADCVSTAPGGLSCVLTDCDENISGDELYCSWEEVADAEKYSLSVEASCTVDDVVTEYTASFNTTDYGTAPDATSLCLGTDMVGEDLGLTDWQGVVDFINYCAGEATLTVKVKGMDSPKEGKCGQDNPQSMLDITSFVIN